MTIKERLQGQWKAIRRGYMAFCLVGAAGAVAIGYPFFHDRALLFWVFVGYVAIMAGVAIFVGLYILSTLLFDK